MLRNRQFTRIVARNLLGTDCREDCSVDVGRFDGLCCLFLLLRLTAAAQAPAIVSPPFQPERSDEDYRYLSDPQRRRDPLDSLKFIPLGSGEANYLSIGGEIRERYEFFNNGEWGRDPRDDDGYL